MLLFLKKWFLSWLQRR